MLLLPLIANELAITSAYINNSKEDIMDSSDSNSFDLKRRNFIKAVGFGAAALVVPSMVGEKAIAADGTSSGSAGVAGKLIDMEAHFNIKEHYEMVLGQGLIPNKFPDTVLESLYGVGEKRIAEMDQNGIHMQVLSQDSGVQMLEPAEGTKWSKVVNNALSGIVAEHPDRFIGLASLAPDAPEAAAEELERVVTEKGLSGANLHSSSRDQYLDAKKYRPIFAKAQELNVPLYLHPAVPSKKIIEGYSDYGADFSGPVLGFAADTSLHAMRLILSGVFEEYPNLKMMLGHLGEGLPYFLDRIDFSIKRATDHKLQYISKNPSYFIKNNFFITTSGMFFEPAFMCAYLALGADNIGFSVDYPHESIEEAVTFIEGVPVSDGDRLKIGYENAIKLFKLA
jgi:2,3-dihydroxybenzoate decarboxylase